MAAREAVVARAEAVPLVDGIVEVAAVDIEGAVRTRFAARLSLLVALFFSLLPYFPIFCYQ
jgi:hypothetical protein